MCWVFGFWGGGFMVEGSDRGVWDLGSPATTYLDLGP